MKPISRKGIIDPMMVIAGILLILVVVILLAGKGLATKATSNSIPKNGCDAPTLSAEVSGDFTVKDGAVLGIEPEVTGIDNIGIKAFRLAAFENFNYEVELFDSESGVKLDSYKNSASLSSDVKEQKVPFITRFKIPDVNCDGRVDDTRLTVKITTIETEDVFEDTSVLSRDYNVRNGVIVR